MSINKGIYDELLGLDFLVYSSHKTGTQTLVNTLNRNGFKCKHCHFLSHIDLERGAFSQYLERYFVRNRRKLNVITVFREPLQRHASSFFQGYGSRPLRLKIVKDETETLIYKLSIDQLQELYVSELRGKKLIGFPESLHEIFKETAINANDLSYEKEAHIGLYETETLKLYFFRFDFLFGDFECLLSRITGRKISKKNANIGGLKWYAEVYSKFKESLVIPGDVIFEVYNSKRDLINLFYDEGFDFILSRAYVEYGAEHSVS